MTPAMSARVAAFLDALDDMQRGRATTSFDVPDHRQWTYLPDERPGLKLAHITLEQRQLEFACGVAGAMTARAVIDLDLIPGGRRAVLGAPVASKVTPDGVDVIGAVLLLATHYATAHR